MSKTSLIQTIPYLLFAIIITLLPGCSDNCNNEAPRARISNNGTDKASVQIKTSGGNTVNVNNIQSGQESSWSSYEAGLVEFTVTIQGIPDDTMIVVNMINCWEYDILINDLNQVSSSPQERD